MRYKRRYKKRGRKRRSSARNYNTLVSVNKNNPLPNNFVTKLRYHDSVPINAANGTVAGHVFRANSPYDPDYTASGHQPRYFDQIMPLYDHYQVLGSKITVKFINNSNDHIVGDSA
jgi:hypothetical protein